MMSPCGGSFEAGGTALVRKKRLPGRLPLLVRVQQFAALSQARRHWTACQANLSPDLQTDDGCRLTEGELERARSAAAQLGQHLQADAPFWRELKSAAQQLDMPNSTACCAWHERSFSHGKEAPARAQSSL